MSVYSLRETFIFNNVTNAVNTPVGLDLRTENTDVPVTIMAVGLAGIETISLWFSIDGGITFEEYMSNGSQLTFTATHNVRACYSGIYLGFTKTSSVAGVSLVANTNTLSR
jgi:hypothetical protein